jgi:hypothetical protein
MAQRGKGKPMAFHSGSELIALGAKPGEHLLLFYKLFKLL